MKAFETSEHIERSLTVNVVSTYLMAIAIIPELQETTSRYNMDTRLSIVGSLIHTFGPDSQLEIDRETASSFMSQSGIDKT